MAKRRLSHQQRRRIRQAQETHDVSDGENSRGLVISHHGGEIEVQPEYPDQTGETRGNIDCNVRANLGLIVSGDHVLYRQESGSPAIVSVLPRRNLLQRQDGYGQVKAVAANVSQLLICLAVEPEPNLYLLDQYLLSAEQQGIIATIILNKIDLADRHCSDPFNLEAIYRPLGYQILHTSIVDNYNIELLQSCCIDQVNVISGVSGVGKSSLTKAILPDAEISIREISEVNREGRHTTRTSRLYHLPLGGDLIDTPGVRGFNPVIEGEKSIASGFREIGELGRSCRFHNCRHINEPGCAVIQAVEKREINGGRYESYLKLSQLSEAGGRY